MNGVIRSSLSINTSFRPIRSVSLHLFATVLHSYHVEETVLSEHDRRIWWNVSPCTEPSYKDDARDIEVSRNLNSFVFPIWLSTLFGLLSYHGLYKTVLWDVPLQKGMRWSVVVLLLSPQQWRFAWSLRGHCVRSHGLPRVREWSGWMPDLQDCHQFHSSIQTVARRMRDLLQWEPWIALLLHRMWTHNMQRMWREDGCSWIDQMPFL